MLLGFSTTALSANFSIGPCATVAAAVRSATALLTKRKIPEPAASAEYLAIATFTDVASRHAARTSTKNVNPRELDRFRALIRERGTRRSPIQYLVGSWEFHNIDLNVRPPVLIPRPETEELVEHVLNDGTLPVDSSTNVLDVGCGSGAILLALLAARPKWTGVGIDLSEQAVALSLENATKLRLSDRARFIRQRVEDVTKTEDSNGLYDVIVSNPPYIPARKMSELDPEIRLHEDERALCGGDDGLDVVRSVLRASSVMLKSRGHLWLEVDESHPEMLDRSEHFGMVHVANYKDLYERPRFCQFVKQ